MGNKNSKGEYNDLIEINIILNLVYTLDNPYKEWRGEGIIQISRGSILAALIGRVLPTICTIATYCWNPFIKATESEKKVRKSWKKRYFKRKPPDEDLQSDCSDIEEENDHKENSIQHMSEKESKLMVAAIDFGTTHSGYAVCMRSDYTNSPSRILVNPQKGRGNQMTHKVPTSVLLKPDKSLHSFGFDAENFFHDGSSRYKNYYFFRQFKMRLIETKNLSKSTLLQDVNGKELPALKVFSTVIKHFIDELLSYLHGRDTVCDFTIDDIHWVITVPAIWDLKAKQFMREAANSAGINDNQLTLALEPEAASLYCQRENIGVSRNQAELTISPGSRYLVIDLGGGTVDVTAHEILSAGCIREIHHACGGYWGGSRVNEKFLEFLVKIFGADVRKDVEQNYPTDWLDLINDFERKKCIYIRNNESVRIKLPSVLLETYERITECTLEESIHQSPLEKLFEMKGDKLSMTSTLFETFFEETIKNIIDEIENVLSQPDLQNISTILMVGGFAESSIMVEAIKNKYENKRIVVPLEASLSVLKGAIIYGFEPSAVQSRICRYSYGIATEKRFNENKDPPEKKIMHNGVAYCNDFFDKHVNKGDILEIGQFQAEKEYTPSVSEMREACLELFASSDENPRFTDEKSCSMVGFLLFNINEKTAKHGGKIIVSISFYGTELIVKVKEAETGKVTSARCNFLP